MFSICSGMTSGQRYWLSGLLLLFAVGLAVYHLEWTSYDQNWETERRLVLPFYTTYRPHVLEADEPALNLRAGETVELSVQHGFYVRGSRGVASGIVFGVVVPVILIGLSGFVAFGRRRAPSERQT